MKQPASETTRSEPLPSIPADDLVGVTGGLDAGKVLRVAKAGGKKVALPVAAGSAAYAAGEAGIQEYRKSGSLGRAAVEGGKAAVRDVTEYDLWKDYVPGTK